MIYDWYKIFNKTEFDDAGFVSQKYQFFLVGVGLKDVLVTQGNLLSVTIDDVMLSLSLNSKNPFELNDRAVYIDENQDVWWGIPHES